MLNGIEIIQIIGHRVLDTHLIKAVTGTLDRQPPWAAQIHTYTAVVMKIGVSLLRNFTQEIPVFIQSAVQKKTQPMLRFFFITRFNF